MTEPIDTIAALFAAKGMQAYLGEPITLAQHMLQAAQLAETAGASDALVAAALLHDIGHVLPHSEADDRHASAGARWLASWLPRSVTEPVRLHVDAKRYLCSVEPHHRAGLSTASEQSLAVQGGPMGPEEARAFINLPMASDAMAVRRWDEAAKEPDVPIPDFEHFRPLLERLAHSAWQ
jgi:gamma-butyrobetaine dioxygenase